MKMPRKIQSQCQDEIETVMTGLLATTSYYELGKTFKGYVVDSKRGRADKAKYITVPHWAYKPDFKENRVTNGCGYFIYYVAHELAHLIVWDKFNVKEEDKFGHNFQYYQVFMEICPKEYQYFELDYKPTSAKYGICKINVK